MIEKVLATLFRYKLLLLLPPLLIPLVVGPAALLIASPYYEVWAGVWVDRPSYLRTSDGGSNWLTPSQQQLARLNELLSTRAFVRDVARRTSLANLVGNPAGEERLHRLISTGFQGNARGRQLVVLRFRADNPQVAHQMLTAIIEAYRERLVEDRVNQAGLAIDFYEARLKTVEATLEETNASIRRYVAANPRLATATRDGVPALAVDPEFAELMRRVEREQKEVDNARSSLDKARLDASAAMESQDMGFQVVDAPQVPRNSILERRKLVLFPAAGLLAGLALSAGLLLLLVLSDRTVRTAVDVAPTLRVVGEVPRLQLKRLPRRVGPDTTRRAIGFVAGTALPPARGVK